MIQWLVFVSDGLEGKVYFKKKKKKRQGWASTTRRLLLQQNRDFLITWFDRGSTASSSWSSPRELKEP